MEPKLLIGDDWSQDHHTICFMNPQTGGAITTVDVPQTALGFGRICAERKKLGFRSEECLVGIETAYNLIVDYYLDQRYPLFVIAPSVAKGCQKRFGSSGAYTDQSAALLLADILRTDLARFTPWRPHSLLVQLMLAQVRLIENLRRDINRWTNRLRAVLLRVNPHAIDLFSQLDAQINLHFLRRYPTYEAVQALTLDEFKAFCREHHYTHPQDIPKLYAHLQVPIPQPSPSLSWAYLDQVRFIAQTLLPLVQRRKQLLGELQTFFVKHPDHFIFDSLPRAGDLLGPALLAKFGEDRERFPSPASVQALAGTCPVTKQSAKRRSVHFRRGCDKEFRRITDQYALATLHESAWAIAYHTQLLQRGLYGSHAIRCLANRWLAIIWKLWQTREAYDEEYHLRQRYERHQPRQ